jgi:hypothetical protein
MTMFRMTHYVTIETDGTYHVQNAIGGWLGQHHVHTKEDFERWAQNVSVDDITNLGEAGCTCGLKPGEMKEGRRPGAA